MTSIRLNRYENIGISNIYSITSNSEKITWMATQDGIFQFDGKLLKKHFLQNNELHQLISKASSKVINYTQKQQFV